MTFKYSQIKEKVLTDLITKTSALVFVHLNTFNGVARTSFQMKRDSQ